MARERWLSLAQKEQRTLTNCSSRLLILALVAFYPLFQVFYTSFTDKVFASGTDEAPKLIGFENYKSLLGLTVMELLKVVDEATAKLQLMRRLGNQFTKGQLESCLEVQ